VSVGPIFTFGSGIPSCVVAWLLLRAVRVGMAASGCAGRFAGVLPPGAGCLAVAAVLVTGAVPEAARAGLWRVPRGSCGAGGGFPGAGPGGAAGVFSLAGVPGGEDALVADDEQRGARS
jgi:hypothetical protein